MQKCLFLCVIDIVINEVFAFFNGKVMLCNYIMCIFAIYLIIKHL